MKQTNKRSGLKLQIAQEALKRAHHSTMISKMPEIKNLEIKARAITVMLGIQRMKEIIQEMEDHFNSFK